MHKRGSKQGSKQKKRHNFSPAGIGEPVFVLMALLLLSIAGVAMLANSHAPTGAAVKLQTGAEVSLPKPIQLPNPSMTCKGYCNGKSPSGCYCDSACKKYDDCCPDYKIACGDSKPACGNGKCEAGEDKINCPEDCSEDKKNSCKGNCGGKSAGNCYCDSACQKYGDCCQDYEDSCLTKPECEKDSDCPPIECVKEPCPVNKCVKGKCVPSEEKKKSCKGYCGGQSDSGCYCDPICETYNDCCPDYKEACSTGGGDKNDSTTHKSYDVPVLVIKYFPLDASGTKLNQSITGMDTGLPAIRAKTESLTKQLTDNLSNGTRYHGYKDSAAQPSLKYYVLESKEFLFPLPLSSNKIPWNPSVYRPDYMKIMDEMKICDYVDGKGVRQVWLWGYHYGNIEPVESDMSMGTDSKDFWNFDTYGDVSNSERINDLPACKKTYTLYNYNYGRGLGEALEDHGHQIEAVMSFADAGMWDKFKTPFGKKDKDNHCGWTHSPPNTENQYDWNNEANASSDCEDWKPDGNGKVKVVSCHTWYGEKCADNGGVEFKVWWMKSIPGLNNGLEHQGKKLKNWWAFYGDFDSALKTGKSLT